MYFQTPIALKLIIKLESVFGISGTIASPIRVYCEAKDMGIGSGVGGGREGEGNGRVTWLFFRQGD